MRIQWRRTFGPGLLVAGVALSQGVAIAWGIPVARPEAVGL